MTCNQHQGVIKQDWNYYPELPNENQLSDLFINQWNL